MWQKLVCTRMESTRLLGYSNGMVGGCGAFSAPSHRALGVAGFFRAPMPGESAMLKIECNIGFNTRSGKRCVAPVVLP